MRRQNHWNEDFLKKFFEREITRRIKHWTKADIFNTGEVFWLVDKKNSVEIPQKENVDF